MIALSRPVRGASPPEVFGCDGLCAKAWGVRGRPELRYDERDDVIALADQELGRAPILPLDFDGGFGKPIAPTSRLNKWCYNSCERSVYAPTAAELVAKDFTTRRPNQPWHHEPGEREHIDLEAAADAIRYARLYAADEAADATNAAMLRLLEALVLAEHGRASFIAPLEDCWRQTLDAWRLEPGGNMQAVLGFAGAIVWRRLGLHGLDVVLL